MSTEKTAPTAEEIEKIRREFFAFEVAIEMDAKYGPIAKWENNWHPENPGFMQPVFWRAYLNTPGDKIIIGYKLSHQQGNLYSWLVLDGSRQTFEDVVYKAWASQTRVKNGAI